MQSLSIDKLKGNLRAPYLNQANAYLSLRLVLIYAADENSSYEAMYHQRLCLYMPINAFCKNSSLSRYEYSKCAYTGFLTKAICLTIQQKEQRMEILIDAIELKRLWSGINL